MDKIEKALCRLTPKERERIKKILEKLNFGDFKNLDIKKLKGREDVFRVRKSDIRIIYQVIKKEISILTIERRRERTYK